MPAPASDARKSPAYATSFRRVDLARRSIALMVLAEHVRGDIPLAADPLHVAYQQVGQGRPQHDAVGADPI
jgi:hypothetical protein